MARWLVIGTMIAAGIVALVFALDLVMGLLGGTSMIMDILFIVAAGLLLYLAFESLLELA